MVRSAEDIPLANLNNKSSIDDRDPKAEASTSAALNERASLDSFEAWGDGYEDEPEQEALLQDAEKQDEENQHRTKNKRPDYSGSEDDIGQYEDAAVLVNKIVPLEDDPSITTLSVRVFVLGITICVLCASLSELFFFKSSAPTLSAFFIILVVLPLGRGMAKFLPSRRVYVGPWSFELNPGPFTIKEHLLTLILAGSGASAAYAGDIVAVS